MSTAARRPVPPLLECDSNPAASGQYRMVQPRAKAPAPAPTPAPGPMPARRRISGQYLDLKDGPIASPMALDMASELESPLGLPIPVANAQPKKHESGRVKSARPKGVSLESLDDAFEDEPGNHYANELDDPDAPEAPDSLVEMMEQMEGTKVKVEAAWPKEMPAIPRPPSVPKMEAVRPQDGLLQPPISRMTPAGTPRPVNEHQVIEEFAKFGPSPASLWQCVEYAFHVASRKKELQQELGLFRERRSSDVELYEKALRHIDEGAVRRGYMMLGGGAMLGILVIAIICVLL